MPIIPFLKTLAVAIISGFAVDKTLDIVDSRQEDTEYGAIAVYKRDWFDENMIILALCGVGLIWVVFLWKKKKK